MISPQLYHFVFLASCVAICSIKVAIDHADIAVLLKTIKSLDHAILEL